MQFSNAQETIIYDAYPYGQEAYLGGKKKLYNDIHHALINNKIQKCQDSAQSYKVKLIVKQDASILFVKNPDTTYINNNKCAYEMSKNVLKYLKDWKAAEHKTGKLNAIYEFDFFPIDLFDDYNENYIGIHIDKNIPQFPGGLNEFRNQFQKAYKYPNSDFKGLIKCDVYFMIDKEGLMTSLIVKSSPYNSDIEKSVTNALQKLKKSKWILPNNYSSLKELYRVRFPVSFNSH
ncbi:MAG: hypothetical protein BGO86_04655 [Chryseobacterium sp. 36-9]|nr:MAG: hypothetical protein BGO86_04655 [Chryseobacterium sp. 36-9]